MEVRYSPGELDAVLEAAVTDITRGHLARSPEVATYYGLGPEMTGGFSVLDRWDARGTEARDNNLAFLEASAARLRDISPDGLTASAALTRDALLTQMDAALAVAAVYPVGAAKIGQYTVGYTLYPIHQLGGVATDLTNLLQANQPVRDTAEAAAYVARLNAFPEAIDGAIEEMRADARAGVIPPDFVLRKTLALVTAFADTPFNENVLYTSLEEKLNAANVPSRSVWLNRAGAAIEARVYPAYDQLADALREQALRATPDAGMWRLPNGPELYQAMIRVNADVDLSAEEIHNIGLAEVARIHAEMDARLQELGYVNGPIGARMARMAADPDYVYPNTPAGRARVITDLNAQLAEIAPLLPTRFNAAPRAGVVVRAVPEFSQDSAPGGYYDAPPVDGSRPGVFWINLRDTSLWPSWSLKTLTYHEANPGHHYQGALALEQDDLPVLRRMVAGTNAFVEGWALYAELLASEMGLYTDDPAGDLGRLQSELFRAVHLVVDTGMHAKQWSRETAIAYMIDTGAAEPSDAEVEVERYAAIPAQALGFKLGMLEILAARQEARDALGADFDIRAFHDVVLADGGLPLPVLRQKVRAWIADTQAQAAAARAAQEAQAAAAAAAAAATGDPDGAASPGSR